MDLALQRVLYLAALDLLDVLASVPLPPTRPDELRVTIVARWGEEYRWQLAALLADTVVLQYDRTEPVLNYYALREICARNEARETDDSDNAAITLENEDIEISDEQELGKRDGIEKIEESLQSHAGDAASQISQDVDEILAEIAEAIEDEPDFSPPDYNEWMERVLPEQLAKILRFLVHLAAAQGPSRVLLSTPDLGGLYTTWNSLRGVYYWDGAWGCCDPGDWITPSPPRGAVILKDAIDATGAHLHDIAEIFASYKLGEDTLRGHIPLIPSSASVHAAAIEFYSRFRRVFVINPLLSLGPQAEPVTPNLGPDWRPALADRILLDAFPGAATIDPGAFEYLHTMRSLVHFRHRIRTDAERVEGLSAEESANRLAQMSRELSEAAHAASSDLAEAISSGRKNLSLTGGVNGLIAGAGFISFGTGGAIVGGLIAASLTAAVARRQLDPTVKMQGTELALVTLETGKPPRKSRQLYYRIANQGRLLICTCIPSMAT
jgi:hypothetical protein